ncbi:MAG: TA system VapC family ribonuclease toxin [Rhodospirillales bacterium]
MTYLLDVNVLIALIDPTHVSHDAAHQWFAATGSDSWATCPITENAVLRIVGHPRYANTPGSPAIVAGVLARLREQPGHVFWSDDISLLDPVLVDIDRLLSHKQVTDSYLLALAIAHAGQLATLDRRLSVAAVRGGQAGLSVI